MHHIFVDFENVPSVDLSLIAERTAEVTLLIGEKQRRLDLPLVRQIHEHAAKVTLIEVGSSGRNALDLVLAWHLGKVAERHASDSFFVVSKDKDFEPLIRHLRVLGLNVTRVDSFAALPFLTSNAPPPRAVTPARRSAAATPALIPNEPAEDDRLAKLIHRLQHKTTARPSRRKTLLHHINGFYGNRLSETEQMEVLETLRQRGIITLDPEGRVDYPVEVPAIAEVPAPPPRRTRAVGAAPRGPRRPK